MISQKPGKSKEKREKMGIAENQISNAARMSTKHINENAGKTVSSAEKELQLEKANAKHTCKREEAWLQRQIWFVILMKETAENKINERGYSLWSLSRFQQKLWMMRSQKLWLNWGQQVTESSMK